MKRGIFLAVFCAVFALEAEAQRTIDFSANTTTGDGQVVPVLTWETSPPAASCEASGQWSGEKGPSGSETLPPITSSATFNLTCTWQGDSLATVSWAVPTTNCDGSPLTDLASIVIRYGFESDPVVGDPDLPCGTVSLDAITIGELQVVPEGGGVVVHDELDLTMRTITGLTEIGDYNFRAHACNSRGICSGPSNVVSKTFTGAVTVVESVGIQVNPIPSPIPVFSVQ